ncbi:hypothetical protein [Croceiramulus getboli]|nr:hypothetical protein P8624_00125 [Flavobacteriaceae bacterium YJPT1-3]
MFKKIFNRNKPNSQEPKTQFDKLLLENLLVELQEQIPNVELTESSSINNEPNDELDISTLEKGSRSYRRAEVQLINEFVKNGKFNEGFDILKNAFSEFKVAERKFLNLGRIEENSNVIFNLYEIASETEQQEILEESLNLLIQKPLYKEREVLYACLFMNSEQTIKSLISEFSTYSNVNLALYDDDRNKSILCGNLFLLAPIIAPYLGIKFWRLYIDSKEFWEKYNAPFDLYSVAFGYYSNQMNKLSKNEKTEILNDILKYNSTIQNDSRWFSDFNKLINFYFPNWTIEQIKEFIPEEQKRYQTDFKSAVFDLPIVLDEYIDTINSALDTNFSPSSQDIAVFEYNNGFYTVNTFKQSLSTIFSHFLNKSDAYVSLAPDSGFLPVDYKDYYEKYVNPSLNNCFAPTQFSVRQSTKQEQDTYQYELNISTANKSYSFSFKDSSDYYHHDFIVYSLNRILFDLNETKRLVNVEQAFIIANPEKLKPLLKKYGVHGWATKYDDGWFED